MSTPPDKFADELAALRRKQGQTAIPDTTQRLNVAAQNPATPDESSRLLKMQMKTGLPDDFIKRNLADLEQRSSAQDFDAEKFKTDSPIFASWAAENPNHWSLVEDDLDNMSAFEWMFSAPGQALEQGRIDVEMSELWESVSQRKGGVASPEEEARIKELSGLQQADRTFGAENWGSRFYIGTFRSAPLAGEVMRSATIGFGAGAIAGAGGALLLGQAGPQALVPEEIFTVPGAALSMGTLGGVSSGYERMRRLEQGLAYGEYREIRGVNGEQIPHEVALWASHMAGVLNGLAESFGIAKTLKHVPGVNKLTADIGRRTIKKALTSPTVMNAITNYAKRHGESLSSEIATEIIQETVTVAMGEAAMAMSPGEYKEFDWNEFGARLSEVAESTLFEAGVMTGIGPIMQFTGDAQRAAAARNNKAAFDAMGENVGNSKTKQRIPEKHKEFVERVKAGGDVQDVRIPIEEFKTYFQSQGLDPSQVAAEITRSTDAFEQAEAAGSDLVIPLEQYTDKVAGTESHAGLSPHLRLHADDMTYAEYETWKQNREQLFADLRKDIPEDRQSVPEIYDRVLNELLKNTSTDRIAAEQQAALWEATYANLAFHENKDPIEMFEARFGGVTDERVQNEQPGAVDTQGSRTLEQVIQSDVMLAKQLDKIAEERIDIKGQFQTAVDQRGQILDLLINLAEPMTLADGTVLPKVDLSDDVALENRLSVMLMQDRLPRTASLSVSPLGVSAIQQEEGQVATPAKLLQQVRALQGQDDNLSQTIKDLDTLDQDIDRRVNAVFSGPAPTDRVFEQAFYHGSRHLFDQFSTEFAFTGEGTQYVAWGTYLAQAEGVGRSYMTTGTFNGISFPTYRWTGSPEFASRGNYLLSRMGQTGLTAEEIANEVEVLIGDSLEAPQMLAAIRELRNGAYEIDDPGGQNPGHLYNVDIEDGLFEQMLDWDEDVDPAMVEKVIEALPKIMLPDDLVGFSGATLYDRIAGQMEKRDPKQASMLLASIGVPGVRFLDAQSRMPAGSQGFIGPLLRKPRQPTRNIVLFDMDHVRQVKRDGDIVYQRNALLGAPTMFDIQGIGLRDFGIHQPAVDAARIYADTSGIPFGEQTVYAPVNIPRAEAIARAYEAMEHKPNDPEVKAAYRAMIDETIEQYRAILEVGLEIEFIRGKSPYMGNPRLAILDVTEKNHLFVFSTKEGFGSDQAFDPIDNPLLEFTEFTDINGTPMLANDVFRVVHDYFGHIKNGVGFRARGGENAWQSHAGMYSTLARRAMTVETRGQNSWVNFGPHGEHNRTANEADTIYADQKIGLLPYWASEEGRQNANRKRQTYPERNRDGGRLVTPPVRPDGRIELTHFSNTRDLVVLDPIYYGKNRAGGEREHAAQPGWIPRTYYGIEPGVPGGYRKEMGVGREEYKTSVDAELLYDYRTDNEDLLHGTNNDVDNAIRAAGYVGYWVDTGPRGLAVAMFDPLEVEQYSKTLYQGAARNEIGLYSAVEQGALDMRLPEWKKLKQDVFTDKDNSRLVKLIDDQAAATKKVHDDIFSKEQKARWLELSTIQADLVEQMQAIRLGRDNRLPDSELPRLEAEHAAVAGEQKPLQALKRKANEERGMFRMTKWQLPESKEIQKLLRRKNDQQQGYGAASGKQIWTKIKTMPGVKLEELKWLGLENWLLSDIGDGKFYRSDVVNFVQQNGVQVTENIASQGAESYIDPADIDWSQTIDTDSENWQHMVESSLADYNNTDWIGGGFRPYFWDFDEWVTENWEDVLEELGIEGTLLTEVMPALPTVQRRGAYTVNFEQLPLWEDEKVTSDNILDFALHNETELGIDVEDIIRDLMYKDFEEAAQASAEESYMEDPYISYYSDEIGTTIHGNDEIGYTINGEREAGYSFNEAEMQAIEAFREDGGAIEGGEVEVDDVERFRVRQYFPGEHDNYRELKLVLPGIDPGFDDGHFEPNVVASDIVEDKMVVVGTTSLITEVNGEQVATEEPRRLKSLHIIEKQSDWHQQGRQRGYDAVDDGDVEVWWIDEGGANQEVPFDDLTAAEKIEARSRYKTEVFFGENRAPDAPFKDNNWIMLGLKRNLIMAIEDGYEAFSWSGEQNVVDQWTERSRELYHNLYTEKMPSMVKRLTGIKPKFFAMDGQPLSDRAQENTAGYWSIEITDELRQKVQTDNFTLFQEGKDAKGQVRFSKATGKAFVQLNKTADLSTFLHESGHIFFEEMADLAELPGASQRITEMYATTLKWLGAENRQGLTDEQLEQFARGFEAYLREGKAPSVELQTVFASFRGWLINIYKRLTELDVTLNDDIRSVFDRMIASDEAIAAAEDMQNYVEIFTDREMAGMTPRQWKAYKATVERARTISQDNLTRQLIEAEAIAARRWYREERKRIKEEITFKIGELRGYRALSLLSKNKEPNGPTLETEPLKLDKAELVERYGTAADPQAKEFLKTLPRPYVYTTDGGTSADILALEFGYTSGDELIQDLIALKSAPMVATIEAETDLEMDRRYPDPALDGSITARALIAVHNEHRADLLAAELRALRRKQKEVGPFVRAEQEDAAEGRRGAQAAIPGRDELAIIKAAARDWVSKQEIRALNANNYRIAEAKASRAAYQAALKGDWAEAAKQKRAQIVNHEAFRATVQAKEESIKTQKYLKRFEKTAVRQRLGKAGEGLLENIEAILDGIDLRQVSSVAIDRANAQKELRQMIDDGAIITSAAIEAKLMQNRGTNWRELTVEEFRGMRDVIKQLEKLARNRATMLVNGERMFIASEAAEIAESIRAANKEVFQGVGTRTGKEGRRDTKKQLLSHWMGPSVLTRALENKDFGPLFRKTVLVMRKAYAERLIPRTEQAREDVTKLYRKHYNNRELRHLSKRTNIKALGQALTRSDMITLLLHWGSETNRAAVLGGRKRKRVGQEEGDVAFSEEAVAEIFTHLTEKDIAFAEDVWDYINGYWPELEQAERRRRGVAPSKVEAVPIEITIAGGQSVTIKGGYFPLHYDPRHSKRQSLEMAKESMAKIATGGYVSAGTRAGATHERVQNHGRVVRLGLGSIDQHLAEVIRDITIGDEVAFIRRLLNDTNLENAFHETGNEQALVVLKDWLFDSAVGEIPAYHSLQKAAVWIRVGFTKSKLAFNALTVALQFTGFFQAAASVGKVAMAAGAGKYLQNPLAAHTAIMERSAFMRARYQTNSWNKDVHDTRAVMKAALHGVPTITQRTLDVVSKYYFWPIARAQMVVDEVVWMGSYWRGREKEGLSDADAVDFADSQVEYSQTSGIFSDRSAIERGTLSGGTRQAQFIRIWTTLISYMLRKGNLGYARAGQFKSGPKNLLTAADLAIDLLLLYTLEAVASALIYGQLPDDDEDWWWWTAKATADSITQGVPFIREIPSAKYGGGSTPLGALATDTARSLDQLAQLWGEDGYNPEELDAALIKNLNKVGGTLLHYPSTFSNRIFDAYWRESIEGEDVAPYEYLAGEREDDE